MKSQNTSPQPYDTQGIHHQLFFVDGSTSLARKSSPTPLEPNHSFTLGVDKPSAFPVWVSSGLSGLPQCLAYLQVDNIAFV